MRTDTGKGVYKRLEPALNAKKMRDAGVFAKMRAEIDAIDAKIASIQEEVEVAGAQVSPGDMQGFAALEAWRANAANRILDLREERARLEPAVSAAKKALTRSNGEVEAVRKLAAWAKNQQG